MTAAINASMASVATAAVPLSAFSDKTAVSSYYECSGTMAPCIASANLTTDAATVTSSGGTGAGPTYAWTRVSGDVFTIGSAASATTTFTIACGRGLTKTAVYRCTVTRGAANVTVDIAVSAQYSFEVDRDPPKGSEPP
jgi:hypothetical protein